MNPRKFLLTTLSLACAAMPLAAHADRPGPHPHYLQAAADLRAARGLLERRPGNPGVRNNEEIAIDEIDAALNDLRQAAIDDGKDIHAHEDAKWPSDHDGKLREADHLLRHAIDEANRGESEIYARHLREDALYHMRAAVAANDRAIHDAHDHR